MKLILFVLTLYITFLGHSPLGNCQHVKIGNFTHERPTVNALEVALNDLRDLKKNGTPPDKLLDIRYLSLAHLQGFFGNEELQARIRSFSFLVNSLSWGPKIVVPTAIDSDGLVFRIDLSDYRWDFDYFEEMAGFAARMTFLNQEGRELVHQLQQESGLPTIHILVKGDWFLRSAFNSDHYQDFLVTGSKVPTKNKKHASYRDEILNPFTNFLLQWSLYDVRKQNYSHNQASRSRLQTEVQKHQSVLPRAAIAKTNVLEYSGARIAERRPIFYRQSSQPYGIAEQKSGEQFAFANSPSYLWKTYDFEQRFSSLPANPIGKRGHAKGSFAIGSLPNGLPGYLALSENPEKEGYLKNKIQLARSKMINLGYGCMSCHSDGLVPVQDKIRDIYGDVPSRRTRVDTVLKSFLDKKKMKSVFIADNAQYKRAVNKVGISDKQLKSGSTPPQVLLDDFFKKTTTFLRFSRELELKPEVAEAQVDFALHALSNDSPSIFKRVNGTIKLAATLDEIGSHVGKIESNTHVFSLAMMRRFSGVEAGKSKSDLKELDEGVPVTVSRVSAPLAYGPVLSQVGKSNYSKYAGSNGKDKKACRHLKGLYNQFFENSKITTACVANNLHPSRGEKLGLGTDAHYLLQSFVQAEPKEFKDPYIPNLRKQEFSVIFVANSSGRAYPHFFPRADITIKQHENEWKTTIVGNSDYPDSYNSSTETMAIIMAGKAEREMINKVARYALSQIQPSLLVSLQDLKSSGSIKQSTLECWQTALGLAALEKAKRTQLSLGGELVGFSCGSDNRDIERTSEVSKWYGEKIQAFPTPDLLFLQETGKSIQLGGIQKELQSMYAPANDYFLPDEEKKRIAREAKEEEERKKKEAIELEKAEAEAAAETKAKNKPDPARSYIENRSESDEDK